MQRPLRQFFELLFLQISSVFTEQSAGLSEESSQTLVGFDKTHVVEDQTESMVAPTDFFYDIEKPPTSELERCAPVRSHSAKSFG